MVKSVGLGLAMLFVLDENSAQQRWAKYKKLESYEVRPGVLMMPRYATDGNLCEIGLERLHYSEPVILDSGLSRKEVDQLLDELIPAEERGKPRDEASALIKREGPGITTTMDYDNVTMQIFSATLPRSAKRETIVIEVLAKVKWKGRSCR